MAPIDVETHTISGKDSLEISASVSCAQSQHLSVTRPCDFLNCYCQDLKTGTRQYFPSPYIMSLTGMILMHAQGNESNTSHIRNITKTLVRNYDTDGRMYFFQLHNMPSPPFHCQHDVDTLACVQIFLRSYGVCCIPEDTLIRSLMKATRDPCGAFLTWIDRYIDNHIDYMANLNVYVLFQLLVHEDDVLAQYLIDNIDDFLEYGSHYYRDTSFPLFLISFYRRHGFVRPDDPVLTRIISAIEAHPKSMRELERLALVGRAASDPESPLSQGSIFSQYFDSSTKTFHSPVLDAIIREYLSCQSFHGARLWKTEEETRAASGHTTLEPSQQSPTLVSV